MKKNISLLVFDLDGTLIDSLGDLEQALNHTLEALNMPQKTMNEVRYAVGDGVKMLLTRCMLNDASDRVEEAYAIFHKFYTNHCCDTTYAYDGVRALLEEYKDTPKAVLTNKTYAPTLDILKHLGLMDYFKMVVGGDTFATRKPNPEGLLHIIQELGATPNQTVMIGDGIPDVAVAKDSGVTSVAILDGITAKERLLALNPDYTVDSFAELSQLIPTIELT
ncbi:MAG: HAD-IA family hydrolase [Fibrobacterales bacterium]